MLFRRVLGAALAIGVSAGVPCAQEELGAVEGIWKLSHTRGGRMPALDNEDQIGRSVTLLGDLDGNGTVDLATSGMGDDDGGSNQGAAYVLFLRPDGRVIRQQKISALAGGFSGVLDPGDQFGRSLTAIGDLDGDGVVDLAVGANYDDDGGPNRGAVWILCLNRDGTVKRTSKISSTQGGFAGGLSNYVQLGRSLAPLGDLDGDGVVDLAVGAPTDSTGGNRRGAVWILFLRPDGSVKAHQKIADGTGGFTGELRNLDWFGFSLGSLGDLDGDGVVDLVAGAALDDDRGKNAGAVWVLFLRPDGTVKDQRKISASFGGFTGLLEPLDLFGTSVAAIGDLNGDGVTELAVGAVKDADGGKEKGAVYVLFLTPQGTVAFHQKISALAGEFPARELTDSDWLGSSLAPLGDFNRDGAMDLVIGARNDDDGGSNRGALYLTYLRGSSAPQVEGVRRRSGIAGADPLAPASVEGSSALPQEVTTTSRGHGPEPTGDLELLAGSRSELVLRLPVPEAFLGDGATVRLLLATCCSEADALEERGILIEPRSCIGSVKASAKGAQTEVEIRLPLPADHGFSTLALQGVWSSGGQRLFTDALELGLLP